MANFSALKTAIQNAIKQNGNEEITGDVLQQILLSIVSTMGDGAINTIEQNLSSETLARQGADNTLQSNIDAEALARGNADTQLQNAINAIKSDIDNGYVYAGIATPTATPVSGKVFYIATAAGTYTNFGGQVLTQGINILRYNGSAWSHQQLIGIDDVPTAGSNNLVKSSGVQNELALGAVYDVSAKNPTAGPNNDGKWESLSALLSDANLNTLIPTAYRKGGMSIKFVHTNDNKYVQYRLMTNTFSTTVADWQGVDDEPIAISDNLVKSEGVFQGLVSLSANKSISYDAEKNIERSGVAIEFPLKIKAGNKVTLQLVADGVISSVKNVSSPLYYNSATPGNEVTPFFYDGIILDYIAPVDINKLVLYVTGAAFISAGTAKIIVLYPNNNANIEQFEEIADSINKENTNIAKNVESAGTLIRFPVSIKRGENVRISLSADGVLSNTEYCALYYNSTDNVLNATFYNRSDVYFTATEDITSLLLYVRAAAFEAAGIATLTISYPSLTKQLNFVDEQLGVYGISRNVRAASTSVVYPVTIKNGETVDIYLEADGVIDNNNYCPLYYNDTTKVITATFYNKKLLRFTATENVSKLILYVRQDAFLTAGETRLLLFSNIAHRLDDVEKTVGVNKVQKSILSASSIVSYPVNIKIGDHVKLYLQADGVLREDDWCPLYYNTTNNLITNYFGNGKLVDFISPVDVTNILLYVRGDAFLAAGNSTLFIMDNDSLYYMAFKSVDKQSLIENTFGYCYNDKNINTALSTFASYFSNESEAVEPFLFFTDPHLFYDDANVMNRISDADRQEAMSLIQKAFNMSATKYVLCGGDWLTAHKGTDAYTHLSWIDGIMNGLFVDKYYLINGNHDNNYQGKAAFGDEGGDTIPNNTMVDLLFKRFGNNKLYYSFLGMNTRWYILDTGTDWQEEMNEYRWEQIAWLAGQLLSGNDAHIAIGMHIIANTGGVEGWMNNITPMADYVTQLLEAYNNKTSITLNGVTYDFSSVTGKVHFVLAGHSHYDYNGVVNNIPVIGTTNTKPAYLGHNITFDLVFADYDNNKLYMTRIGQGSSREIDI